MKKTFVVNNAYADLGSCVVDELREDTAYLPDDLTSLLGGNFDGKVKITFEYEVPDVRVRPKVGERIVFSKHELKVGDRIFSHGNDRKYEVAMVLADGTVQTTDGTPAFADNIWEFLGDAAPKLGDNYRIVGNGSGGSLNLIDIIKHTKCRNGVFVGLTAACPKVAFFVFPKEIPSNFFGGQIYQSGPTGLVWDPSQPKASAKVGQKIRAIKVVSEGQWVLVEGRIFEGRKIIVDRTDNTKLATVGQVFDCEGLPMVGVGD